MNSETGGLSKPVDADASDETPEPDTSVPSPSQPSPYKPPPQLRPTKRPQRRSKAGARPTVTRVGLLAAIGLVLAVVAISWTARSWVTGGAASDGVAASATGLALDDTRASPAARNSVTRSDRGIDLEALSEESSTALGPDLESGDAGLGAIDVVDRRMAATSGPPRIALVIDDLGRSVAMTRRLLALDTPMSFAVLPFEAHTAEVTATLRNAGAEILVHLPMQGLVTADPGPGALVPEMSDAELRSATHEALEAVEGAVGVNNHMGSVLSADTPAMHTILTVVSEEGKFFLDSRTTAESVGFSMARTMGLPAAERQVFLDGDRDREKIRQQFRRALEIAEQRGFAIAIGHPYPATLDVLEQELGAALEQGFEFVRVSAVLERDGTSESGEVESVGKGGSGEPTSVR